MKILIINQYNSPPEYGNLNRHFYLALNLKKLGHEVTVLVGSKIHNSKIQMINHNLLFKKLENNDINYFFIKTIDYKNNIFKRILAMFQFYFNSKLFLKKYPKQQVVIGSTGHFLNAVLGIWYKSKFGAKSITEIRDLWPESLIAFSILRRNNYLTKFLFFLERYIYFHSDYLVFTMEGGKKYIMDKGWDKKGKLRIDLNKVHHINNGIDLETFHANQNNFSLDDPDLETSLFKVCYIGSIRKVNNLGLLIDVAKQLLNYPIVFLIYGNGNELQKLIKLSKNLTNLRFKGSIEKKYVPKVLFHIDLNIITGKNLGIYNYGVSPNKLFDYFASNKPILSTYKANFSLIEKYDFGIQLSNSNSESIVESILWFYKNKSQIKYDSSKFIYRFDYFYLANKYDLIFKETLLE